MRDKHGCNEVSERRCSALASKWFLCLVWANVERVSSYKFLKISPTFWLRWDWETDIHLRDVQNWDSDSFLYLSSKVVPQQIASRLSLNRLIFHLFTSSRKALFVQRFPVRGFSCSGKNSQKLLANSFKRWLMMSSYSLAIAFNIRTRQHLFKVKNTSVYLFCTKLSQSSSFFLNRSVVFLSAKLFVQNRWRDLLSLFKW